MTSPTPRVLAHADLPRDRLVQGTVGLVRSSGLSVCLSVRLFVRSFCSVCLFALLSVCLSLSVRLVVCSSSACYACLGLSVCFHLSISVCLSVPFACSFYRLSVCLFMSGFYSSIWLSVHSSRISGVCLFWSYLSLHISQ
jgi:hypothetical protein